jgi:hypothetical protein
LRWSWIGIVAAYPRCSGGFTGRDSFVLRSCNEPIPYGLLAGKLTSATCRLGPLPRRSLRWLLVKPAPLHFPKHTFTLHFLLQDAKSLIDIVVSDEHLQNALLCVEDRSSARRLRK